MLAREHGYWVSGEKACERLTTRAWLAAELPRYRQRHREYAWVWAGVGAFLVAVDQVILSSGGMEPTVFLTYVGGFAVLIGLLIGYAFGNTDNLTQEYPQLYGHPWQAWPCHIDGVAPTANPVKSTITLLGQNNEHVRQFRGKVPLASWRSLTDGYGVLWICGDLRETVAVAQKGGAPVWTMAPVAESASGGASTAVTVAGLGAVAAEEAVRAASDEATRSWLDEMGL